MKLEPLKDKKQKFQACNVGKKRKAHWHTYYKEEDVKAAVEYFIQKIDYFVSANSPMSTDKKLKEIHQIRDESFPDLK